MANNYLNACIHFNFYHICRFLMCYLTFTNLQRQGAVVDMTAKEVVDAEVKKSHCIVHVGDHQTTRSHGCARIVMPNKVYTMLKDYVGEKSGTDLAFWTSSGERVTNMAIELERFSGRFGKKFTTENNKAIIGNTSTEADERSARSLYQHLDNAVTAHLQVDEESSHGSTLKVDDPSPSRKTEEAEHIETFS